MAKILIVDDDESFLHQYSTILSNHGYEIETVLNATDVFDSIESFKPDLILLDTFLSTYDGRTIGKMIKLTKGISHIPIILCSADSHIANTGYHSAADLFISKPFELDKLLQAIDMLIKK
jgi:DNA-binding response OmpR family regulator